MESGTASRAPSTGDLFQVPGTERTSPDDQFARGQVSREQALREQAVGEQPLGADADVTPTVRAAREQPATSASAPAAAGPSAGFGEPAAQAADEPARVRQEPPSAAPAPAAVTTPAPAPVAAAPLPTEELTSVVASAGLEWVQTTHAAAPSIEEIAPVAPRPRRQRKPKPQVVAEPLQQVETQPGNDPAI